MERKTKLPYIVPADITFKVKINNRSKANKKTPEQCQWRRSEASIVKFKHVLHLVFSIVLIVNFEHVMLVGIAKKIFIVIK